MKLVSFAHYTCGGLLCDVLNNTLSAVGIHGGIASVDHAIGKIGDSNSTLTNFDVVKLLSQLQNGNKERWVGTHCWLGKVDCNMFDAVINVTVTTYRSKLYRWLRAYNHYYSKMDDFKDLQGLEQIDKQRETAKNYLIPFLPIDHPCVVNIEFADVVENNISIKKITGAQWQKHYCRWQQVNSFLYEQDIWHNKLSCRLYEAEYETTIKTFYQYE